MKRAFTSVFSVCLLLLGVAAAQPTRVAVLAFDTDDAAAPYRFGLATGLQRSLNVIDNLYVPPIGDTLVVAQRTDAAQLDTTVFADAFGAQALVSGLVSTAGDAARVDVFIAEPGQAARRVSVNGTLQNPADLLGKVAATVVRELNLTISAEDQAQLDAVVAQTPTLADLSTVGEAGLGLGVGDSAELKQAAADGSSWALSERAGALGAAGQDAEALTLSQQAVKAAPEDVEALVSRAVVLAAAGDIPAAKEAFTGALELNPAHAVALAGQARLSDDPQTAQRDLKAALESYPRYAAAYLELALVERQSGNPQTALQTLRNGVEKVPGSSSLASAFVTEAVRSGNTAEAVSFLENALQQTNPRNPKPEPSLYALAGSLPAAESKRALTILRRGREAYPRDAGLALAEAEMLSKTNDYVGAEGVLRGAQSFAPNNPEVANQLALAQAEQGKTDEAAATLETAAQQNPDLRSVLERNLAQIYVQTNQNEAAVKTLSPLLESAPQDAGLYLLYGSALGRTGAYDRALTALDEALKLDPKNQQALQTRQFVAQTQRLAEGSDTPLSGEAEGAVQDGLTALERSDVSAAQTAFDKATTLSQSGLPSFYQGYTRQLSGDLRGAVKAYDTALADFTTPNPGQATVLNNAGFAYFRLGRLDKAVDYLSRAVAADPSNSEAQLNLGLIYYDLGRLSDARAPLEAAVKGNPNLAKTTVETGAAKPVPFDKLLEEVRRAN